MDSLFAQYLAIYNNEYLPKSFNSFLIVRWRRFQKEFSNLGNFRPYRYRGTIIRILFILILFPLFWYLFKRYGH